MKVVVTGSTGFVGRSLLRRLAADDMFDVRVTLRGEGAAAPPGTVAFRVGDLGPTFDCRAAVEGCDAVVHLAARVHVLHDRAADPLQEFRRVNVEGTMQLARQAVAAGVRRFVFLSSIKVNGEGTRPGAPFVPSDPPAPVDPYGISKWEAERELLRLAGETGLQVSIVRCPLVYGPGVKANFLQLMHAVRRGIPLPLGRITNNRRSLIAVDNLADLLTRCLSMTAPSNRVFLASDGQDLSTAELLRRLGIAMGRPARLLAVPPALLWTVGRLCGRVAQVERLLGSLQIDSSETRAALQWAPPITVDEGLRRAVRGLLGEVLD